MQQQERDIQIHFGINLEATEQIQAYSVIIMGHAVQQSTLFILPPIRSKILLEEACLRQIRGQNIRQQCVQEQGPVF